MELRVGGITRTLLINSGLKRAPESCRPSSQRRMSAQRKPLDCLVYALLFVHLLCLPFVMRAAPPMFGLLIIFREPTAPSWQKKKVKRDDSCFVCWTQWACVRACVLIRVWLLVTTTIMCHHLQFDHATCHLTCELWHCLDVTYTPACYLYLLWYLFSINAWVLLLEDIDRNQRLGQRK